MADISEEYIELSTEKENSTNPNEDEFFSQLCQKSCVHFIKDELSEDADTCQCGNKRKDHHRDEVAEANIPPSLHGSRSNELQFIWDSDMHTIYKPTDAFGEIKFKGQDVETNAKFVRLADDTDLEDIWELFSEKWQMENPEVLISMIGDADQCNLRVDAFNFLTNGVEEIVREKTAWIITGGTNAGVNKLVGDALQTNLESNRYSPHLYCIGIAPWGITDPKEVLDAKVDEKDYYGWDGPWSYKSLEKHHSHFLLVDNGTANQFWTELPMRLEIIKFLRKKINMLDEKNRNFLPTVSILVGGGRHAIASVRHLLCQRPPIPVLILKGSGRAADILEAACHLSLNADHLLEEEDSREFEELTMVIARKMPTKEDYSKVYREVLHCIEGKRYIKVCDPNNDWMDLKEYFVDHLVDCYKGDSGKQWFMALSWNSPEIALRTVLTEELEFDPQLRDKAVEFSLAGDMVQFLELLLDRGFSLSACSTVEALRNLHKKRANQGNSLLDSYLEDDEYLGLIEKFSEVAYFAVKPLSEEETDVVKIEKIKREQSKREVKAKKEEIKELEDYPYTQLFIWAILNNMFDMADLMLKRGNYPLAKTLMGCCLLRKQAELSASSKVKKSLFELAQEHHRRYEALAITLLEECYNQNADDAWILLYRPIPSLRNLCCLDIAMLASHKPFLANDICQSLLTEVWMGGMQCKKWHTLRVFLRVFMPFLLSKTSFQHPTRQTSSQGTKSRNSFVRRFEAWTNRATSTETASLLNEENGEEVTVQIRSKAEENGKTEVAQVEEEMDWWEKMNSFYSAPVTKFNVHLILYVAFLLLYSYVVLVKLEASTPPVEWILFVWVLSLTMEEFIQAFGYKGDIGATIGLWFKNFWNKLDFLAILIYYIAFGLRFNEETRLAAKVLYGVDCMLWIVRMLEVLAVNKYLGPYVIMIGNMVRDLLYFLFVMGIFLWSYTVVRSAVLRPSAEPSAKLISDSLYVPYLQIFGELFVERTSSGDNTVFNTKSAFLGAESLGILLLDLYLLIANVLLLNLLIAVFNNTYTEVQENSKDYWGYERYQLISDYYNKPLCAGPFAILYRFLQLLKMVAYCRWKRVTYTNIFSNIKVPPKDAQKLSVFEVDCMSICIKLDQKTESREEALAFKTMHKDLAVLKDRVLAMAEEKDRSFPSQFSAYTKEVLQHISKSEGQSGEALPAYRSRLMDSATALHPQIAEQLLMQEAASSEVMKNIAYFFSSSASRTQTPVLWFEPGMHRKALKSPYPGSGVRRIQLSSEQISWNVEVDQESYSPQDYTARIVLAGLPWADTSDAAQIRAIPFNKIIGHVNRTSHGGHYDTENGLPRNPVGRTGLQGRGLLTSWGPNHIVKVVMTRIFLGRLQFLRSKDKREDHKLILPMARAKGEGTLPNIILKAFDSAILERVRMPKNKRKEIQRKLNQLLSKPVVCYCCYEDDERNTDNAWIETKILFLHDESGGVFKYFPSEEKDSDSETRNLAWAEWGERMGLDDSDREALEYIALHQAMP